MSLPLTDFTKQAVYDNASNVVRANLIKLLHSKSAHFIIIIIVNLDHFSKLLKII
jgi:hypothetical protein